jgi:hypothetical protein
MGLDNERRTARVILLNAAHQVLLIRFVIERRGQQFVFWATPGDVFFLGHHEQQGVTLHFKTEAERVAD